MTITKEDNRLLMQAHKQPKVELFPESETKFFLKVADARMSFNKDQNSKVTGLTLHQMGNKMAAKRVGLNAAIPPEQLAEQIRGFHWMVAYGSYLQEVGYAVKKEGLDWLKLA
jgi:hypothetical protein